MSIKGNTVGYPLPDPRKGMDMTGPINMNGQALGGLNTPTADDQAVNWGSVKEWGKAKAGFIYPLASAVVPEGFLLCDGAAYSRVEYPELFAAIGTMYGSGDGSTTFNVPDITFADGVGAIIATGKGTDVSVADIIMGAQALPLGLPYGGTGATDPKTARENLEITPENIGAVSTQLVWENASAVSAFAGQTVSLDLANYTAVLIRFRVQTTMNRRYARLIFKGCEDGCSDSFTANNGAACVMRVTTVNENGIVFSGGSRVSGADAKVEDDSRAVPEKIYGIKGVSA